MNIRTKTIAVLTLLIALSGMLMATAYIPSPNPAITLSPNTGFATTITGFHFDGHKTIYIYWDNNPVPYVSADTKTNGDGSFIALITAPTTTPGTYTIKVKVNYESVTACFTVPDTTGPQGPSGADGAPGATGPAGETVVTSNSLLNGVMCGPNSPPSTLTAPLGTLYLNTNNGELWQYSTRAVGVFRVTGWSYVYQFIVDPVQHFG